ncbi:bifunctional 2-keto-4-hydroxyglutarate aldolase/2-keto-3-deoxy-6-phosphogluconate aldolase [Murdochiella vaginalis]|uniref:bifunctional 2-keto-4-hydroxyglutarate aldolase/2-keto-3-deoxy-6-phosphogluconate aldolase n=1 Tax=Murdochiella vaginalis TaxID=1852373 RepID=UPI0008FE42BE|nr:bifunctional 2-keto-4-hydroxyglutarate aldolase/2-keto-3-deoxy-6-phosphogluconate aldolase [Murdochiella vaginalis]
MNKFQMMQYLYEEKLVAVIRGNNEEQVIETAKAVVAGGIHFLEITFTVPNAQIIIGKLNGMFPCDSSVVVGAGTCLDAETARIAILAGAKFVVSPHFDPDIMKICNSYCVPVFPGSTDVTGIKECLSYGAEVVKLFPGEIMGIHAIKAFKGPLPHAEFMPTGGVNVDNVIEWLKGGAFAVGVGGSLTGAAKNGEYTKVTEMAKQFVEQVHKFKSQQGA